MCLWASLIAGHGRGGARRGGFSRAWPASRVGRGTFEASPAPCRHSCALARARRRPPRMRYPVCAPPYALRDSPGHRQRARRPDDAGSDSPVRSPAIRVATGDSLSASNRPASGADGQVMLGEHQPRLAPCPVFRAPCPAPADARCPRRTRRRPGPPHRAVHRLQQHDAGAARPLARPQRAQHLTRVEQEGAQQRRAMLTQHRTVVARGGDQQDGEFHVAVS